jgi:ATP-dependent DNA helicase RecG
LFGNVRLETLGLARTSSSRNARLAALLQDVGDPFTGRPVAENRGSGVSMMIGQVRASTGAVPVFDASLDQFQVIIPRISPLSGQVRRWLDDFSSVAAMTTEQQVALAMAAQGYDVDTVTLDRLGLDQASARRQLSELVDAGLLRSRRARDRGPYRLGVDPPPILGALEWGELGAEILRVLDSGDAMSREEIQHATGAGRSSVVNALAELLDAGVIVATAPPHSPSRRYRLG